MTWISTKKDCLFHKHPDQTDTLQGSSMRSNGHQPKRRRPLYFACFVFCGVLVFIYIQSEEKVSYQFLADDIVSKFLIDTPGCQIPAWDPWDASVKHLFRDVGTYKCSGQPSFLRTLPNGAVAMEDALLQYYYEIDSHNISCDYQEIRRNDTVVDENVDSKVSLQPPRRLVLNEPISKDFIKTSCTFGDRSKTFKEFIPLTPLKAETENRCVRLNKKLVDKPLNVIFLGLDSVSHLNFLRHFPKCNKYLSEFLSPITMNGYTKVGDNTYPNLVPLLTGMRYDSAPFQNSSTMFFDDIEFSWKSFARLGYRTLLAEDAPRIATFNYYRNGFKVPPTDYYYRPFALAVEESDIKAKSRGQCFGSKMEMEVIYDYLRNFIDTMGQNRPFFAFVFLARLTHDVFNFAGYADEPTYQLLKYLNDSQTLNNTMLIFYSDHGIRYGNIRKTRIGQYEERMPFMHFMLPKWFLKEHEAFGKNLQLNKNRLTSPFDIHATIIHLANLMSGNTNWKPNLKPGISLFREIPANRTCTEAGISPHWCTCQVSQPIPKDRFYVKKAAVTVIRTVNSWINPFKNCIVLTLDKVLDARVTSSAKESQPESSQTKDVVRPSFVNYLIVVLVSPSSAIFEATVRCETSEDGMCEVLDDISRINEYGKQSDCISDVILKKYCLCA